MFHDLNRTKFYITLFRDQCQKIGWIAYIPQWKKTNNAL